MSELIEAVHALLSRPGDLPPPPVRKALRRADGLTQEQVATALGVKRLAVARWEAGQVEPRAPHRQAYAELLRGLAARYPQIAEHAHHMETR
ncbi:helix-turn-helix transcriptional regulator [Streptomyces sp. NPDC050315]|uniref:helix-turn-helix domain-containing protein n=1 Tax=Streptomyces sp. NPDC050315 TaxID=3155039 RepID=UPI00342DD784